MFIQRDLFTSDQCNELIDFYRENYDETFRLDWGHEARYQRLLALHHPSIEQLIHHGIVQHHESICDDLNIEPFDPYFMEMYISKYEVGEGVGWHKDRSTYEYNPPYENERVYNFSVCLNDDYVGGQLLVDQENVHTQIGTCTFFSVHTKHMVSPIDSGTRYSLIGWVYKKPLL